MGRPGHRGLEGRHGGAAGEDTETEGEGADDGGEGASIGEAEEVREIISAADVIKVVGIDHLQLSMPADGELVDARDPGFSTG